MRPALNYSVSVDPSPTFSRNPFSEKKWRKFQLTRLFSGSSAVTKVNVIDVQVINGDSISIDKWLVVLCLGSGQTRNMALDRYAFKTKLIFSINQEYHGLTILFISQYSIINVRKFVNKGCQQVTK